MINSVQILNMPIFKFLYTISSNFVTKGESMVKNIIKRDGRKTEFDIQKIENAISKAMNAVGEKEFKTAHKLACFVEEEIDKAFGENKTPTVEEIQDIVEKVLMKKGHEKTLRVCIKIIRYLIILHKKKNGKPISNFFCETM